MRSYDDFVIKFESGAREGCLRAVLTEPFNGAAADLSDLMCSHAAEPGLAAGDFRGLRPPEELTPTGSEWACQMGSRLFDALMQGAIREAWLESQQRALRKTANGLRLRLLFELKEPCQRELSHLAWELLYRPETRDFLGLDPRSAIVRSVASHQRPSRTELPTRLRLVVSCPSPVDRPRLRVDLERERLELLARQLPQIELCFASGPTFQDLIRELDRSEHRSVVLFCGHGELTEQSGGALCFEDTQGYAHVVPAPALAICSKSEAQPWLAVLNACQTAALPTDDDSGLQTSVAAAMVASGMPAVLAMRSPVTDQVAITFSFELFQALAAGEPVEAALTRARRALYSLNPDSIEWSTPVLTTAVGAGELRLAQGAPLTDDREQSVPELSEGKQVSSIQLSGFDQSHSQVAIGVNQGGIHQDLRSYHAHHGSDVLSPAAAARLLVVYQTELEAVPAAARPEVGLGLELLDDGRPREALEAFCRARKRAGAIPELGYYEALARVGGRRLGELELEEAEELQSTLARLREQRRLSGLGLLLLAALKREFYQAKGFLVREPNPEGLLAEFSASPSRPADASRFLTLVALPEGSLRDLVTQRLG